MIASRGSMPAEPPLAMVLGRQNVQGTTMSEGPQPTPSAPTLDERALARALSAYHFIGGRSVRAAAGKTFAVVNPSTGDKIGRAAEGDAADVETAVANAAAAQKDWGRLPARKRGALVAQCGTVLTAHTEELARLMTLETGKALRTESRVEAGVVADLFTFYGGLGGELKGESVPFAPDVLSVTVREPLGVVGAIIPWNVPLLLMALKVAPALVAGNTVVVKSAEEAPLTVLRLAELLNRVLPPGCLNVLSGFGPACGGPLVAHPKVRKVTFTGSVEVGRIVSADRRRETDSGHAGAGRQVADDRVRRLRFRAHGDGRNHLDALHPPGPKLHRGQPHLRRTDDPRPLRRCTGGEGGRDGDGRSAGREDRYRQHYQLRPTRQGARLHRGRPAHAGRDRPRVQRHAGGPCAGKRAVHPAVHLHRLAALKPSAARGNLRPGRLRDAVRRRGQRAARGERQRVQTAASVSTNNLRVGLRLAHALEAGLVQINQNLVVQANISYGGVKSSGLGKEASLEAMLEHFTHKKTIMVNYG